MRYVNNFSLLPGANSHWLAGFVAGDGHFSINFRDSGRIIYTFDITQHILDVQLMKNIVVFLGCGTVYTRANRCDIKVQDISSLAKIIIPLFKAHPLCNIKEVDFIYFCTAIDIISQKDHKTVDGLTKIKAIVLRMNNRSSK